MQILNRKALSQFNIRFLLSAITVFFKVVVTIDRFKRPVFLTL